MLDLIFYQALSLNSSYLLFLFNKETFFFVMLNKSNKKSSNKNFGPKWVG
jgi:hypothetical protein